MKKNHGVHIPRDESRVKRFRDEVLAKSRALSKYVEILLLLVIMCNAALI